MRKITLNSFFYYSTPWEGDNSNNSGNMIREKGWRSPIDAHLDLIIYQMPKQTFGGKLVNSNDGNEIHLDGGSITAIISACNKRLA